jgi:CRP-like cAMP-binding protein
MIGIDVHLDRLRARHDISEEEAKALQGLFSGTKTYKADQVAIRAGEPLNVCTLLLKGLMCRFKDLPSGARQVTELHVAGDFADLHGFTLKRLDHHVGALTACEVAIAPHERIKELTERFPRLTRIYWFTTNLDASIHREWEVSLGRRSSLEKMAHLFCELDVRFGLVGLTNGDSFDFPLTQEELAECLGITSVHVNRTLQQLRERQLIEFRSGRVAIQNREQLRQVACFEPDYLYLGKQPL